MDMRQRAEELMDEPDVNPRHLAKSLAYIRLLNRWMGYTRATLSHFEHFSRRWKAGQRVTVLDVATGSGDVPAALVEWGDKRRFDIRVVAIDLHQKTIDRAAEYGLDRRIGLVRADAVRLPFEAGSFDYVMTSMFLHHLDDEVIVRVFEEMDRVALRGVVASDLIRDKRAARWIRLFSFAANPVLRHDSVVSVLQSFREQEIMELVRQAGLDYLRFQEHFGYRFVVSGEK